MAEIRILDQAIDQTTGTVIYEVYFDVAAETVYARVLDNTLTQTVSPVSLGTATEADIISGASRAKLAPTLDPTQTDNEDYMIVFGELD